MQGLVSFIVAKGVQEPWSGLGIAGVLDIWTVFFVVAVLKKKKNPDCRKMV